MSQNLADRLLSSMPGVKHLAATVPGSGGAALRLYRLASIAVEACCPINLPIKLSRHRPQRDDQNKN
jgi:hypothetical protein